MTTTARTVGEKSWRAPLQGGVGVMWLCRNVGKREGRGGGQQVGGGERKNGEGRERS
eukprot:CAMPEP_0179462362 /NCGR_PEP_ID=MMETSP0799-20121207/44758_1 /TAXON_ID=46947 /ORGANISM="Geminigera cryophila, Strain CCMP2564" /LENGTH=56 /DNA_ID=CAMNT_0021265229 /DNA_START=743 /DNA_END=913 /DNA_ORIENTATION=+